MKKNIIINNFGLKLIALLVSFLIWLMVVNGDDPEKIVSFTNVPITVVNKESIINSQKVYKIVGKDSVTVYIRARRSVLQRISKSDIEVKADLKELTFLNTVPLSISCRSIPREDMWCEPASMEISIEDSSEESFMVTTVISGKPGNGYEVGSVTLLQGDAIYITGPASQLNKIDKVMLPINVNGLNQNQTCEGTLKVIDKNGDEFTENQMENLIFKTMDGEVLTDAKMKARIELWQVNDHIQLNVETVGTPAEGYQVTKITTTPSTISLAGSEETLTELGGKLTIPDAVSVEGATKTVETTINIAEFLQDSDYRKVLRQAEETSETVSIKVQIEKIDSTTIDFPVSQLTIRNKPVGMDIVLTPADKIPLEIRAETKDAEAIAVEDVTGVLDLADYQEPGNYKVPVQITLPSGYELVSDVTITVNVKESQSSEEE